VEATFMTRLLRLSPVLLLIFAGCDDESGPGAPAIATAMAAPQLGAGVAKVNCPVVEVK
jgi:hypothetical protein